MARGETSAAGATSNEKTQQAQQQIAKGGQIRRQRQELEEPRASLPKPSTAPNTLALGPKTSSGYRYREER